MTLRRLVMREIAEQRLTFVVGMLAVVIAVGVFIAEVTILAAHDRETQSILAEKEALLTEDMRKMEDDYRTIMKELGFNLYILPRGQRLDNFYDEGYASKFMPEEHVTVLSHSDIITIRHLLPSLEQKIRWPEQSNRSIVLIGTRGEVPFIHRDPKEPMLVPVIPGKIVLGYELWNSLRLSAGDRITLMGREFTVETCHSQRGTKDDITVWIDLATAQKMLGRKGLINAILALKCLCAGNDIESIRAEITSILPDTRVIEIDNKVATRERARKRAKAAAESTISAEAQYRARLRQEREAFAGLIIPLIMLGSAALVGVLAFNNVRERRAEIGILRAIGLRSRQILGVFLAKAAVLGIAGAVLGVAVGFTVGLFAREGSNGFTDAVSLAHPLLFAAALIVAPLLSLIASWVPAFMAAREDPADILRME